MRKKLITLAYIHDENLHKRICNSKENYWDVYIREINEQLGLKGEKISLRQLEDKNRLYGIAALIIGWQSGAELNSKARDNIKKWVMHGGVLIGFGVEELDELFGIESFLNIEQTPNDYTESGYFEFVSNRLTRDIHSFLNLEQKLLILSDIRKVKPKGGAEIAHLYDREEEDTGCPAILMHKYGEGYAAYFAFDVAKTIWLLHQGRPYTRDIDKEENVYRGDLRVADIGKNKAGDVLYADEILFLLQNIIALKQFPFIYQIPPLENKIPEALLYWSGDGCGSPGSEGLRSASDFMKSKGLPYNIHVLSRGCSYNLTSEDAEAIIKNGHELSIEYYFCYYSKDHFDLEITDEENLARRYRLFKEHYDISTISTGCHGGYYSEKWGGWIEDMKWRMHCGGKADNTFMGLVSEDIDSNAPRLCFGHGTAYPYYFYDDFRVQNRRINFIEQPLTAYELGRRGQTGDPDENIPPHEVHPAIDMAVRYHLTLNMFYHAVNIAKNMSTRRAIEEVLTYIAEKKACIVHMGTDEFWRWWDARSRSHVSDIKVTDDNHLLFRAFCENTSGMIVKIALQNCGIVKVLCDKAQVPYEIRNEFGNDWIFIIVPNGDHEIEII